MGKVRRSYRKYLFDENIKVPDRTLRRKKAKNKFNQNNTNRIEEPILVNNVVLVNIEENQMLTIDNNNVPENNAINFNKMQ